MGFLLESVPSHEFVDEIIKAEVQKSLEESYMDISKWFLTLCCLCTYFCYKEDCCCLPTWCNPCSWCVYIFGLKIARKFKMCVFITVPMLWMIAFVAVIFFGPYFSCKFRMYMYSEQHC